MIHKLTDVRDLTPVAHERREVRTTISARTVGPLSTRRPGYSHSFGRGSVVLFVLFLACAVLTVSARSLAGPVVQAVSVADPSLAKPISASGDSFALSITPDGAFVLLAGWANDLAPNYQNAGWVNLYLRNRTNGIVSLVSVNMNGTGGGNGNAGVAAVTPDGRYVVFESDASNLVTNDPNRTMDIFVRDVVMGTTRLVSVNLQGTASGNGASSSAAITPDGRYIAFVSAASDLVDGDTNGIPDVFLRDLQTGNTTLVSRGAQSVYVYSRPFALVAFVDTPVITPDGRYVAFTSTASNLVASSQNTYQEVYVRDVAAGRTLWASTNVSSGTSPASYNPVLSDDGHFLAFKTSVSISSSVTKFLVFRRDLQTGALEVLSSNAMGISATAADDFGPKMSPDGRWVVLSSAPTTITNSAVWLWDGQSGSNVLVSANRMGQPSTNGLCNTPAVSPDGRFVAFLSNGTDLVTNDVNGDYQVYVRDMQSGTTRLATVDSQGAGSGDAGSSIPNISADGRYVLFDSLSDAFGPHEPFNSSYDVFVRDLATETTELVSARPLGTANLTGNNSSAIQGNAVSADGRFVVFEGLASNLVPGDTNGFQDVFVRDLPAGASTLVSVNQFGTGSGNGNSYAASISAHGRYVVFTSSADNLVANDSNKLEDVFVRDRVAGTTVLVSVATNGTSGNRAASVGSISADGNRVVFQSAASNLAAEGGGATGSANNVFVRDMHAGSTIIISTNPPGNSTTSYSLPMISPDGRFVAFQSYVGLWLKDLQTDSLTTLAGKAKAMAFSGNSRFLAAITNISYLSVSDLIAGTRATLALGTGVNSHSLALSHDGTWVAFSTAGALTGIDTNKTEDVYLYDLTTQGLILVSTNWTGTNSGNGPSYWPVVSSNGRYVVFRSSASDLVSGDANAADDIFLWDRLTGQGTLLSHSLRGLSTAAGMSLGLAMAPDANVVVFNSVAGDLVDGDFNGTLDVFSVALDPPLKVDGVTRNAGQTTLSWTAVEGQSCRVQYKDSLADPAWHELAGTVTIAGGMATMTDITSAAVRQRYYRLVAGP